MKQDQTSDCVDNIVQRVSLLVTSLSIYSNVIQCLKWNKIKLVTV